MTITIAWTRKNKSTSELIIASDSRPRSRGAMDQAQKIFRLERGDCCLGFCGDAQIAYPLFVQVGSTLNNFIRTRTRAEDVTDVAEKIGGVLNNIVQSWDLGGSEKTVDLASTMIMFAEWSWKFRRFEIGYFKSDLVIFHYHHSKTAIPHPWREVGRSLLFIGDYKKEYLRALASVLERRHGTQPPNRSEKKLINFDYEPVEALALMLNKTSQDNHPLIGGAPQLLKVYPFGNDLPIVVRLTEKDHYFLGRRPFIWEKTEFPVLDISADTPRFYYPMSSIPLPEHLANPVDVINDLVSPDAALGSKDGP